MGGLRELLSSGGVVVLDGAMGTLLYERGAAGGGCYDELNLTKPALVSSIHAEYREAGADVITTNTFGANPVVLERYYGLGSGCARINEAGVALARQASGGRLVAGSVGPLTRPAEVFDELSPEEVSEAFRVQLSALVGSGVDLVIFETFSDPVELASAVETLREISDIPAVALLTFLEGGQTLGGLHPLHAGRILDDLDADAVGVNCGTGPMDMLKVVQRLSQATGKPICAMPNAGMARFERGRFHYPHHPEHLGLYAAKLVGAGCTMVGGCCGTGPEHVKAIASCVRGMRPGPRRRVQVTMPAREDSENAPRPDTTFSQMLARGSALSVEVDPPRGPDCARLVRRLGRLKGLGVDAVNVSDGPMARLRMSPTALATVIRQSLGLEVVIHVTCRDKNILALQSDLLGLSAMGLRNILALSGDPPSIGDYPFATAVYDVRSDGLVRIVDALNRARDVLGNALNAPAGLFQGTGVSSAPQDPDAELRALERKVRSGLGFIQTQPVFDLDRFEPFLRELGRFGLPVMAGLMPVLSAGGLDYLSNEVPGIYIPAERTARMKSLPEPAQAEAGMEWARKALAALRAMGTGGICIMPALHGYDVVEDLLR